MEERRKGKERKDWVERIFELRYRLGSILFYFVGSVGVEMVY